MMFTSPPPSGVEVRPVRLLFVDDEPLVLRSLGRVVRAHHPAWEVRCVHGPIEALEELGRFAADVVVTDLSMPKMNGVEFLRALRERHPAITRMVYSAHVDSLDRAAWGDLAHATLLKPAHTESMLRALENVVRVSGATPVSSGAPGVGTASA